MSNNHKIVHEYVYGVFVNEKYRILIAQLYGQPKDDVFYWSFPGGRVEEGRSKEDTLRKIIYDNLNVDINLKRKVETVEYRIPFYSSKPTKEVMRVHLYYVAPLPGQTIERRLYKRIEWLMIDRLSKKNLNFLSDKLLYKSLECLRFEVREHIKITR